MKVLIIGGGGHVGRIVKNALEAVHQVTYLDLRPVAGAEDRTFVGDLADEQIIRRASQGQDAVIYMALGQYPGDKHTCNLLDPAFDVNVRDQYRSLAIGLELGVRKFITISTLGVIGPAYRGPFVDENTTPQAFTPYGLSKRLAEHLYQVAALNYPDGLFLALRFNLPQSPQTFTAEHQFDLTPGALNNCAMGPNDVCRLMLAALELQATGCHIVQTTGDLTGTRFPNTQATALLDWAPQGN